ncbi:thioesterase family protein [Phycicoccus sp. MQZ13P-5]|uniref:Thioesterase family protein n=2 Tax=Phycicoccus sonneratiae TaxID=2807628 RepID=A0ABS2CNA5_9MICO|nr:thioesterase family protein [Phycicoccus sonneraticus]
MALGARALSEAAGAAGHPDVLTWSTVFLSAAQAGPVSVHAELLREGRSVSTGQVRLVQEGPDGPVERARLTAVLGDAPVALEPAHRAPGPPSMPPPEECVPARRDGSPLASAIALLDRLDIRVDPATAGFAMGRPTGRGVLRAWVRMADGREPDVAMLPFAVDCLMPVAFDLGVAGWAPTLELSGQVLGRPASGWLRVAMHADVVAGSFYVEDADVWDSTGRLVARSRQLAGIRVPAEGLVAPVDGPADRPADRPAG